MPVCNVCGGTNFVCDSGFYFCEECQTQSQDVREVRDEGDAEDENDFSAFQDANLQASFQPDGEIEKDTLSIWEGFNYALVGLVNELIKLGAKPELKLAVLQLWTKYLGRMEVAFFSDNMDLPKLGPNFRKLDAKLIFGHIHESLQEKQTVTSETTLEDYDDDAMVKRKKLRAARKAVMNQTYEKALLEMTSTSQTLANMTLNMLSPELPQEENPTQASINSQIRPLIPHHPGLLVRNRLIAFLYLGILLCEDNIKLSDLLRWISEGHLSYSTLWKFFPESALHGENLSLFFHYQPKPSYCHILKISFLLAKYLQLQSLKVLSAEALINHYIKELNLPDQIGLVARRLLEVLPPIPEYCSMLSRSNTLPNVEARAIAHILVVSKLIFGLDDSTEFINSNIARKLNLHLKSKRDRTELFVWEDWERFCTFKRTAFSLFQIPSFLKKDLQTTTIHNANSTFSLWNNSLFVEQEEAVRGKVLKLTLKSFLQKIKDRECSDNKEVTALPSIIPSTSPHTTHIKTIINFYKNNTMKIDESEWGALIKKFPYQKLSIDFGKTSVEYLTHSTQFVMWAQCHRLEVGLHAGSSASSISFANEPAQKIKRTNKKRRLYTVKAILDKPLDGSIDPATTTTWNRDYKYQKPLILPEANSGDDLNCNSPLPKIDRMRDGRTKLLSKEVPNKTPWKRKSSDRHLIHKVYLDHVSPEQKKKMLFVPHTEYWHSQSSYEQSDKNGWSSEKKKMPLSFEQLLNECASLIECEPSDLYKEMLRLEALHDDINTPKRKSTMPDCPKHKELKNLKDWWNV